MFQFLDIVFDRELWKKRRARERIQRQYASAYEDAKRRGLKGDDLQSEMSQWWIDIDMLDEDYRRVRDAKWLRHARRLEIPTPEKNEKNGMWERGRVYREWLLTDIGLSTLRGAVRQEERDNREALFRWGTLIIGIVGAISGLIAVISVID